ncbi:MAG: hypothetical protein MJA29_07360 [Candidatus Omnitrophica bacterium]|nr:hypothetical protein [Candidatus Omnitrophota bacterium]
MTYQHADLAAGRWQEFSLAEQMAHIGSEVSRALSWQKKGNMEFSRKAAVRSLELLDLSLDCARSFPQIKEFSRLREAIVDYFYGANEFSSSDTLWRKYFDHFNLLARKNV